ncbi:hypothetical protein KJA15_03915 [Patescibacteria group bacterium]|nr:hypothetical protein [Patescibacteria group bacterium]
MKKTSKTRKKISKKEIKRLISLPGKLIGTGLIEDLDFILKEKGEEGVKKVEKAMAELGYPLKYRELKNFKWYPVGYYLLSVLVAKELFEWDDETIRRMGANAQKISLITKIMMKYFVTMRKCFQEISNYWNMYYTVGKMEGIDLNEKERCVLLILKDFPGHQVYCRYMEGVIQQIVSYIVKEPKCREVKCCLKGKGEGHLFKVTWEK